MKKILMLVTVFCSLCTGSVFANPYLCCDPMTPEVTQIDVTINTQVYQVARSNVIEVTGAWCLVDLEGIAEGSYTAFATAHYGVWGESAPSADFLFVKPAIATPVNIMLGVSP